MSNRYSYRQYGNVALIFKDDRAVCTAKFEEGAWKAVYYQQVNETRVRSETAFLAPHWADTLDRLIQEMALRPAGEWIGRDTIR